MNDAAISVMSSEATHGVLSRRVLAWLVDLCILAVVTALLHLALAIVGIVTLGLGLPLLALLPLVPFAYAWIFLASAQAATPGQRLMQVHVVEHRTGRRPSALEAFVSTLGYALSLTFAPILLLALLTARHRTLHDVISGLLVVRGAPLTAPATDWNMNQSRSI